MTVTIQSLQALVTGATEDDVLAAVADYSTRNPLTLYAEISRSQEDDQVYDLPADFLFTIKVEESVPKNFVLNNQLRFITRPSNDTLHIWYAGKHVANQSDEFENMADDEAHIIALKLKAIVLRNTPVDGKSIGLRYRQGDVEVDTKGMPAARQKELETIEDEYLAAIKARIGQIGVRSEYPDYVSPGST